MEQIDYQNQLTDAAIALKEDFGWTRDQIVKEIEGTVGADTEPNTGADTGPQEDDDDILPDGGTFSVTEVKEGAKISKEDLAKAHADGIAEDKRSHKNVGLALEHAVERGKLRPYEAIEAALYFDVLLQPWVQRQHDHHVANTKRKA